MQCTVEDFAAIGGELICIGGSDGQILPVAETSLMGAAAGVPPSN